MTSGTRRRLALLACTIAAAPVHATELDVGTLLPKLARPAPDTTTFVEVRFSSLLETPLVVSGQLQHRADGALVRRVESPYRETTELRGENVRVEREGAKPRQFSLDRAPELRGMLASFGALLKGDRALLDRYFTVSAQGTEARWEIHLAPRDAKLGKRLNSIVVSGADDAARCFTLTEPDSDASVMALGIAGPAALPQPIERAALARWCSGTVDP